MDIEVPIIIISLVGMFFWTLVGYSIGYRAGKSDAYVATRKMRIYSKFES